MNVKLSAIVATIVLLMSTSVVQNEIFASGKDTFKVKVRAEWVDSETGPLRTCVELEQGDTKCKESDPFESGDAGNVPIGTFTFSRGASAEGEAYTACIERLDIGEEECAGGSNGEDNAPEEITVILPESEARSIFEPVYYNDESQDDFDAEQGAEINIREINGDNNRITINQGQSLGEIVRGISEDVTSLFQN